MATIQDIITAANDIEKQISEDAQMIVISRMMGTREAILTLFSQRNVAVHKFSIAATATEDIVVVESVTLYIDVLED